MLSVVRQPPWVPPGHYYSPSTNQADIDRALIWNSEAAGVDLRESEQVRLLGQLEPYLRDFRTDRYRTQGNNQYGRFDAAVLQGMLRHFRPKRVVEVGSGYSTTVLLDTADIELPDLEITCVEPYPDRLFGLLSPADLSRLNLLRQQVQTAPLEPFLRLEEGDILFLDSTHVAKPGSDVLWEVLHLLPKLAPGVLVHVHDIHWPFEYPESWLRERRDWNETYFWHAFLAFNASWQVRLMTSWAAEKRPESLPRELRHVPNGSLWVQRVS